MLNGTARQTVGLLEVIDGVINFEQLLPYDGFIFF